MSGGTATAQIGPTDPSEATVAQLDRAFTGPAEGGSVHGRFAVGSDSFVGAADSLWLHRLYEAESALIATWTRAAHASAYPVFWGAVPATAFGTELAGGSQWEAPFELALAEGGAYLLQAGLKALIERPRPYLRYDRIDSRSRRLGGEDPDFSMPSGHATAAFAISTSWYLSYRHPGVTVPLAIWSGGVALSRPRLGVHYPSDVLVGAVLGIAAGVAAHHAGPHLRP